LTFIIIVDYIFHYI